MPFKYRDSLMASGSSVGSDGYELVSSGEVFLTHPSLLLGSARGTMELTGILISLCGGFSQLKVVVLFQVTWRGASRALSCR
jgi:hypothetical protein